MADDEGASSHLFRGEGEAQVRKNLADRLYADRHRRGAEEFLRRMDADRADAAARRKEAIDAEQLAISRSAKDANWKSARAAHTANTISWIALGVAVLAVVISMVAMLENF